MIHLIPVTGVWSNHPKDPIAFDFMGFPKMIGKIVDWRPLESVRFRHVLTDGPSQEGISVRYLSTEFTDEENFNCCPTNKEPRISAKPINSTDGYGSVCFE